MSDRPDSVITSRREVNVGAPKNSLEDAFYIFLRDYPWLDHGFDTTNVPREWEREMAINLLHIVRDHQGWVESHRSEIL